MVRVPFKARLVLASGVAVVMMSSPVMAQSDAQVEEYANLLAQISNKELEIAQQEVFVARQNSEIADIQKQLEEVDGVKASIGPMVEEMTAALESSLSADYPFDIAARQARMTRLREAVDSSERSAGDKMRRALNAYKIEVNYGQSLEAYDGNHPVTPTVRTGDDRYQKDEDGEIERDDTTGEPRLIYDGSYLRYGRLAYVYLNKDGTDPYRYQLAKREWVKLPKSSAADIRRAIRVSRGEAAPTVVKVPVVPTGDGQG